MMMITLVRCGSGEDDRVQLLNFCHIFIYFINTVADILSLRGKYDHTHAHNVKLKFIWPQDFPLKSDAIVWLTIGLTCPKNSSIKASFSTGTSTSSGASDFCDRGKEGIGYTTAISTPLQLVKFFFPHAIVIDC